MSHTLPDYTTKYKINVPYVAYTTSVKHVTYTAADDLGHPMTATDLWFREANIEANYNAKYGDAAAQNNTLWGTTGVLSYTDFNLANLYFKNAIAGKNITLYCTGILMTEGYKHWLGLI